MSARDTTRSTAKSSSSNLNLRGKERSHYFSSSYLSQEIHAAISEGELAKKFNSIETLKAHPRLSKFFDWVAKRPTNFLSKVPKKRKT